MNKKIKVIELLNKIANGEEVPKKIKSKDKEFYFQEDEASIDYLYRTDKNGNGWLVVQDLALNDEVEILEDNTEEIEELPIWVTRRNGEEITQDEGKRLEMADKINEIIRYIKGKEKK